VAPNLANVYVRWNRRQQIREKARRNPAFPEEWFDNPARNGSLQTLTLVDCDIIEKKLLIEWAAHTDFSALHSLVLGSPIEWAALVHLTWNCNFASLKHLTLDIKPYPHRNNADDPPGGVAVPYKAAARFFESLPPLSSLVLRGWRPCPVFPCLPSHHSATLTRLVIEPWKNNPFTASDITQIASFCPIHRGGA
jgi:hypothetical protein